MERKAIIPMFLVFMTVHLKHCVEVSDSSSLKFRKDVEKLKGLVEGCQNGYSLWNKEKRRELNSSPTAKRISNGALCHGKRTFVKTAGPDSSQQGKKKV